MARHRNIRTQDFSEEYDDYDYQYGRSIEEDFSISPGTANQYLFDHNFGQRRDSDSFSNSNNDRERRQSSTNDPNDMIFTPDEELITNTKHSSSIDYIKDTIGKTTRSNEEIEKALKKANNNVEMAIDLLLKQKQQNNNNKKQRNNSSHHDGDLSKSDLSRLYKALTTEHNSDNSPNFNYYDIRKFIKEFVAKSLKQNTNCTTQGRRGTDSTNLRSSPDVNKNRSQKVEETKSSTTEIDKKEKKLTSSKLISEPAKPVPMSSPNLKVKQIKQKPIEEIRKIFEKKRLNDKLQINLVVVGHVDAGKSTIMGHLLSLLGKVSKKIMHKNETEAKKAGKASFMYAWVLDETDEERNRGITIDVGQHRFETDKRIVNILDAPGHRDFIPNMITGTTKADCAMLVIDATNGEFESGFESGGQTQEHILLLRSFGIAQIVIAINKMDNVNYNQTRYQEIVDKVGKFLKQVAFKDKTIKYIPCSGMTGENLMKLSTNSNFKWYNGPTLIEIIDNFSHGSRPIDQPFRMSISDFYKGQPSGLYLHGKIDYGYVENNQKLIIMPNNEFCIVKNIMIDDEIQPEAFSGDVVAINIPNADGLEISIGNVLCDISSPCNMATKFEARIVTFNTMETPIINGTSIVIYSVCCQNEIATITKLCQQLDKNKQEIIKKNPRLLARNQAAIVQIKTSKPICIETFDNCKIYGRFVIRSEHITLGTGVVTKILR